MASPLDTQDGAFKRCVAKAHAAHAPRRPCPANRRPNAMTEVSHGVFAMALKGGGVALIDAEDVARVSLHSWRAKWSGRENSRRCYPTSTITVTPGVSRSIRLHRFILEAPAAIDVDHRDRDTLNCRRGNLRLCTRLENAQNRGPREGRPLKGVYRKKGRVSRPWAAQITANRKQISLGYFETALEAARAYDTAAARLHGEFACLNFPLPVAPFVTAGDALPPAVLAQVGAAS